MLTLLLQSNSNFHFSPRIPASFCTLLTPVMPVPAPPLPHILWRKICTGLFLVISHVSSTIYLIRKECNVKAGVKRIHTLHWLPAWQASISLELALWVQRPQKRREQVLPSEQSHEQPLQQSPAAEPDLFQYMVCILCTGLSRDTGFSLFPKILQNASVGLALLFHICP